jgi:hypothetical protein
MRRGAWLVLLLAGCGCSATDSQVGGKGGASSAGASGAGAGGGIGVAGLTGSGGAPGAGGTPACSGGPGGGIPAKSCADAGILLAPPYASDYTCLDLGEHPSIPVKWGGLIIKEDDPYTLLLGGSANEAFGMLYAVGVVRDADCHIVGFSSAPPVAYAEAAYNDGGVVYGPGGVLFFARWPVNELGLMKPGSTVTNKVINTEALGVVYSLAALNFVPSGFGGAGQLKLVAWPQGQWYTASYAPDGQGTFDVGPASYALTIGGGPEGFVYIEAGNRQFSNDGMLVSEWSDDKIAAYEVDGSGDPMLPTRRDFVTGLTGAEGAFLDPLSGDFLFSTFAFKAANRVIAIRGFKPPPPIPR